MRELLRKMGGHVDVAVTGIPGAAP